MTADEAVAAAEAEGLTLVRSSDSATGFKGVTRNEKVCKNKPFKATAWRGGERQYLGYYATAEEAALAYARALGPAPMTAEEALSKAEAEGLVLRPRTVNNPTGLWACIQSPGPKRAEPT